MSRLPSPNSLFSYNEAIGHGANPAASGRRAEAGGRHNDGNAFTLTLCGVKMTNNTANEGGGAIFFVRTIIRNCRRSISSIDAVLDLPISDPRWSELEPYARGRAISEASCASA